jgi:glycosyltransferase involved in cell wall biosynthesis
LHVRVLTFGRFADDNFGGLERYVFELARSLRGEAQFVNIVAARGAPPDLEVAGETVYARSVFQLGGTPVCPSMPWHARRLHAQAPFDIAHLQFPADPMAHLATASLPASVRRVITWHSDIVRQKTLLKLYRPFLDRLVRDADAIILPTPAHLSSSEQLAGTAPSQLHVVPYGFDLSRFLERPQGADAIRSAHPGKLLVFALGRHVYYKGFEYLIRALPLAPDARVLLGGKGPLSAQLAALARELGVDNRLDFVGRIPEEQLTDYYHACDVYCMPSVERAEAFGIVQLEAMAAGKPVVCCELGNGVNYVNRDGETGLVVPPKSPAALAAALQRLHTDPSLRTRLGEQGRQRALEHFTLQKMREGTLAVYRKVLEKNSHSRPVFLHSRR